MADLNKLLFIGLLLNSALYLTGVFVAGLATGNAFAWRMALVAMGLTYLGYAFQLLTNPLYRYAGGTAVAASVVAGILAGVALLVTR